MSEHSLGRYCQGCGSPHSACTCGVEVAEAMCDECESEPCLCDDIDMGNTECAVCGEEDDCECFEDCDECEELNCECICEKMPGFYGDEGELL